MSNRGTMNRFRRKKNTPEVIEFCEDNDLKYKWINGDWHLRIEGKMDIYPGKKRFFWIPGGEWGFYDDYDDLGRIMIEKMGEV